MLRSRQFGNIVLFTLLAAFMSGCVTYPIKSMSLDEHEKAPADKQIRTDLVYYLPMSMVGAKYTGGDNPKVELTPVTIADRNAGFVVERPRRYGGRGTVAVATKAGGDKGKSTQVGLLSSASLVSADETFSDNKIATLAKALEDLPEKFKSEDKKEPQSEGSGSNAPSGFGGGSFKLVNTPRGAAKAPIVHEALCGPLKTDTFTNLSAFIQNKPSAPAVDACVINISEGTKKRTVRIRPIAPDNSWLASKPKIDGCSDKFGNDRRNSSLCYRQRVSLPFQICIEEKKKTVAKKVSFSPNAECKGLQTIQFVEVFDRSRNFSVAFNGQQFVSVNSSMTFENGTLIAISDNRPGVIKSVAQAPFELGADIVNSLGLLVAAVFVD